VLGATVLEVTVLVEASCSEVYAEVRVKLDHEVGLAPAIARRAICIVSNPYVSILQAVISNVIACGGFFPLSSRKEVFLCQVARIAKGFRIHGFFLLHLSKEVFYTIAFNKDLIIFKIKSKVFVISCPRFNLPSKSLNFMRYVEYNVFEDTFQIYAPTLVQSFKL
jgi:hypothetical protein